MSLEELRKSIDDIDSHIVKLIGERLKIAQEIGEKKRELGREIEDRVRENKVLARVKKLAQKENISPETIESIYRQIVRISKNAQGTVVAFQGEIGAYSEEAAFQFFGSSIQTHPRESLDDAFKAVEQGEAQYAAIPVENSLEGSISRSYDLLLESDLSVCGEIELRVSHCLIASPGARLESIKKVYSHPQALAQCHNFLKQMGFTLIPTYDTAGSVKMIKEQGITDGGAIASARAAEIYGMKVMVAEIEDNPNNFTRFFVLSRHDSPPTGKDKTSIVFSLRHKPGTLYNVLQAFANRNINLTKLESRPTRLKPWEYNFYLDFEGHRKDKAAPEVLAEVEKNSLQMKVLGSYPRAK